VRARRRVAEAAHRGTTDSRPGSVEPCGAGGGWFEYPFPKPGEERPSRKVTYMLAVPGTSYVVGAGVYGETVSLGELEALSGGQR
jgi:signal transduction histidine kinase